MGCSASAPVLVSRPPPNCPVKKEGFILYCPSKGGNWKSYLFKLYEDSSFIWFGDAHEELGCVRLKDIAPLIAIGQHCLQVPNRPDIPPGQSINHMMAYPFNYGRGTRRNDMKINWILFRGDDEMKDWMQILGAVLPPPPQAQQNGQVVQPAQPVQPYGLQQGQAVAAAPPPGFQPHLMSGQASNAYPPPQQYYPQQNGYHPQQPGPQHTTVVVNQHHHVPQQTSGDGFATGLLLGGAMGWGMGYGWGHGHHYHGFGWGSWGSHGSFGHGHFGGGCGGGCGGCGG